LREAAFSTQKAGVAIETSRNRDKKKRFKLKINDIVEFSCGGVCMISPQVPDSATIKL
jgi:hypothetical protein